ncbi:RES family NAD+ phosphorylase [Leeuwenhoekiella sp. MAR_2009_132]|uniref:RES family NAD+ phosphorylase n=1 Tax=Leeuwenhoekiella sp. MAR_2009_132 TaxID=1392489 RepID=UPI00048C4509|nr:RES family NAD+ phosphorylase [Leeuwenhoekiella sp. MAR_2009_132]
MELYRIATEKYANILTASGAAARWNKAGEQILYSSSSRALATLELIVNYRSIEPDVKFKVMILSLSDDSSLIDFLDKERLPLNWHGIFAYPVLQNLGSSWYRAQNSLALRVPSAVIPQEYNYLLNTSHPAFASKVKLAHIEDYFWDDRLA